VQHAGDADEADDVPRLVPEVDQIVSRLRYLDRTPKDSTPWIDSGGALALVSPRAQR
jgi:hypothetical protein